MKNINEDVKSVTKIINIKKKIKELKHRQYGNSVYLERLTNQ